MADTGRTGPDVIATVMAKAVKRNGEGREKESGWQTRGK
jgi:hypothetical protein